MKYSRARVAITAVPGGPPVPPALHIGHARSVLAGQLIARAHGCPFHVRLDGIRPVEWGQATADLVLSIHEMLSFLEIDAHVYYHTLLPLELEDVRARTGLDGATLDRYETARQNVLSQGGPVRLCLLEDDVVIHWPSLIIRGAEFRNPQRWAATLGTANSMTHYILCDDLLHSAIGRQKHEVALPLVLVGGAKMSKSSMNGVAWEILTMVSPAAARSYLIASLLSPGAPLAVLLNNDAAEPALAPDQISPLHHRWDWQAWSEFVKQN